MRTKRKHGSGNEVLRKLTKTGRYTYYVTIPKAYIEALGWRERQKLTVTMRGSKVIVGRP